MDRIHSHIDTTSDTFRTNRERMQALVDEYRARADRVHLQGGAVRHLG